ncbi:MAG TPA: LacI family DNA-binding transcriptional regulator [Paludibacter sp.]|nr:LacI family DNA-binding transcriptional regulator [Paludibacter sp.]
MMEKKSKVRIKDIAALAGVSEGTVDRVLHKRGDVSEKSLKAVTKVLEEINYTPNLLARSLASKKRYRFVCLIPAYQPGEYWESVDKGFDLANSDFEHYNIAVEKLYFDQFDANSFVKVSGELLLDGPDAVFLSPIFKSESLDFTSELTKREIPFSFIDSNIPEANYLAYYGQNSFQSGYIAAKLLVGSLPGNSQVMVIRTQRKGSVSNQTLMRYNGFMEFFRDKGLSENYEILNVELKNDDEAANLETIRLVFASNTNLKAAITFNSKVYRLAMHLVELQKNDIELIGYDLLEKNVGYLKEGVVSYLIAQRPEKQAYFAIRDMCRKLIFQQETRKVNYVPVDILIKENIEDYMRFNE